MPPVPIRIQMTESLRADMGKRAWERFMREGNEKVGFVWWEKLLPQHFTQKARVDYRHQARKPKYLAKKRAMGRHGGAKYGGNVDLVLSGELERHMRRAATVRAYPSRVTVTLAGPRYMTMTPRGGEPHKFQEVSAMTQADHDVLLGVLGEYVSERYNHHYDPRTTTT